MTYFFSHGGLSLRIFSVFLLVLLTLAGGHQVRQTLAGSDDSASPGLLPQVRQHSLTVSAGAPWEQRAVWWSLDWRYRLPVTFTAGTDVSDAVVAFSVDWGTVLRTVGATGPLDLKSLRLVEYTSGGHIIPSYDPGAAGSLGCNRFDRAPVAVRGGDPAALWALVPNRTRNGQTRQFFLYFDTAENAKSARDYHYLGVTDTAAGIQVERIGPETECGTPALGTLFARSNPVHIATAGESATRIMFLALGLGGQCAGDLVTTAEYGIGSAVPALEMGARLSGSPGGCSVSGSSYFTARTVLVRTSTVSVIQGNLHLVPDADLTVAPNQMLSLLAAETATPGNAWIASGAGAPRPLARDERFAGPGDQVGLRATKTAMVRLDGLQAPALFPADKWVAQRPDPRSLRIAAPANGGVWRAGEPLDLRFTVVLGAASLDAAQIADTLAGLDRTGTVALGSPAALSEELLQAQLRYYEDKAWNYVQSQLAPRGWGVPWNIAYAYVTETGTFLPAHDNDSSMGAGFLLYAASLKAAMTGEQRFYDIANAYANYFLSLEAEDIAEHGAGVAGRISYGFNGSDVPISFNLLIPACAAPPRQVADCTSTDQMATAAMGLWQYANLDSSRASLREPVRALLQRMGDYNAAGGANLAPNTRLQNLRPMLGLGGRSSGTPSRFPMPGLYYGQWQKGVTTALNTGGVANTFFIEGFFDRILSRKDPALLAARYTSVANDTGTATRGYYPLVRGLSFPAAWGFGEWEFPAVGMFQSAPGGLVARPGSDPASYQQLVGGNRDALSGRLSEHASVIAWAAMEQPDGRMEVAGAPGPYYSDYLRSALHSLVAVQMDDSGGFRESALGTLGRASNVHPAKLTADFSGYALLAFAQYRLLRGEVANPMPANRYDYIQGVAERDGVTTVSYWGDQRFEQRLAFPNNGWPVLGGGALVTPTLTYRPDGTAAEFAGTTLVLPVTLSAESLTTGTLRQVPMVIAPESGTAQATMEAWEPGRARLVLAAAPGQRVSVRFGWLPPGTPVRLARNGVPLETAAVAANGEAPFIVVGDGTAATLEARW